MKNLSWTYYDALFKDLLKTDNVLSSYIDTASLNVRCLSFIIYVKNSNFFCDFNKWLFAFCFRLVNLTKKSLYVVKYKSAYSKVNKTINVFWLFRPDYQRHSWGFLRSNIFVVFSWKYQLKTDSGESKKIWPIVLKQFNL